METRFWELLGSYFGSGNSVNGVSETQWEELFSGIWKAIVSAESFLAAKAENPVKGVFTVSGVIEAFSPAEGGFRVSVSGFRGNDPTESVMVALARCGLSVKRLPATTAERETARVDDEREQLEGWDVSAGFAPRLHGTNQLGCEGVGRVRVNPKAPQFSGPHAHAASRMPSAPPPTPAKAEICEQHPAGPHERFLKSACPWCQGRGGYFGPAPTPTQIAAEQRATGDLDGGPSFPSAKCQKCGAWLVSYVGDNAPPDRCPSCTRTPGVTIFPDTATEPPKFEPNLAADLNPLLADAFEVLCKPETVGNWKRTEAALNGLAIKAYEAGFQLGKQEPAYAREHGPRPIPDHATSTPELAGWKEQALYYQTSTPGYPGALHDVAAHFGKACARIDELEAENYAILEGAQEWEYEAKEAKRQIKELEQALAGAGGLGGVGGIRMPTPEALNLDSEGIDDDELTPAETLPPPPPPIETQIQGAVAEAAAELFKWLEPRMRLNSDKTEERTRVFTGFNALAQRVVTLCRVP